MFYRNEIRPDSGPGRGGEPWHRLEEYHPDGGMWASPPVAMRSALITASAGLMIEHQRFADAMRRVVAEWPRSVRRAMLTPGLNRRAWLGHAGCYIVTGSPEETTRLGWHALTIPQQERANAAADAVIQEWLNAAGSGWRQPALFGGDSDA